MANRAKFNLSFAGCGFLGIYHVGVAACLKKYAPHMIVNKASGASAGAIAATCLLCDAPLGNPIIPPNYPTSSSLLDSDQTQIQIQFPSSSMTFVVA